MNDIDLYLEVVNHCVKMTTLNIFETVRGLVPNDHQ